ncbi:hypothetical protein VPHG_00012 [Vibrio phage 11895-B1]|uniref:hypothetical protein n=1 Tax=Vibrio phage 11895-B1 TaxID=754075 RepID=UPI0002C0A43E|nr:hypothetical protein VPHG_00012 [Vibrio phage 11895-B1]AGH32079.1 hypothetical protein VPHG_00012 [Vibrio phage 11895-B1]
MEAYTNRSGCAVTHEVVVALAKTDPELLMRNGEPFVARCLYLLGFDIRFDLPRYNYSTRHDVLLRSGACNKKARSTTVYSGHVRYIESQRRLHHMYETYDKIAILDVPVTEGLVDIQEIGGVGA